MKLFQVENLPMTPTGAIRLGKKGSRLGVVNDGGLQPPEFGERWMRKSLPWQGCGVRACPCHLSGLWCPSVVLGNKDGVSNSREVSPGNAICSTPAVILGENEMRPKRAQPCLPN